MTKFEFQINEELNHELSKIADAVGKPVDDLIHEFLLLLFQKEKINLILKHYKDGNIKAREAWKLSGLSYQEFQDLANN
ncbi:MAG: hypothetical protein ACW99A_11830 [Candidatus Kariarchaeaceae archaeon]|jgi:hypothetical protein